jgi:hypothetical protein
VWRNNLVLGNLFPNRIDLGLEAPGTDRKPHARFDPILDACCHSFRGNEKNYFSTNNQQTKVELWWLRGFVLPLHLNQYRSAHLAATKKDYYAFASPLCYNLNYFKHWYLPK